MDNLHKIEAKLTAEELQTLWDCLNDAIYSCTDRVLETDNSHEKKWFKARAEYITQLKSKIRASH